MFGDGPTNIVTRLPKPEVPEKSPIVKKFHLGQSKEVQKALPHTMTGKGIGKYHGLDIQKHFNNF